MQRYILDKETKTFYKEDLFHIKNVMRFKTGEEVILCLEGNCFLASLEIDELVSYQKIKDLEVDNPIKITIVQGNLKGTKLDDMIKYASIFGATEIIITDFERSIARMKNIENKLNRYQKIAKEAAELSHRSFIPEIRFVKSLKEINYQSYTKLFLADEESEDNELRKLSDFNKEDKFLIVVGPEGGITNNERNYLVNEGFKRISLGKYIFPAEIAAISALNTLNSKLF